MKRKSIFISLIIIIFLLLCCAVLAFKLSFMEVDSSAKSHVKLKEATIALMNKKELKSGDDTDIAVVMDKAISYEYFSYRMSLYEAWEYENPPQAAWDLIKTEVCEERFAEKYHLLPSETEITEATTLMRELAEYSEESHELSKDLILSMGLSEDEYWKVFKPKYETRSLLIHENVNAYCIANNLPKPTVQPSDYTIKNRALFDGLEISY